MNIRKMSAERLKKASQEAILNANYIASRLQDAFPVLYTGRDGRVAHECILDIRPLKSLPQRNRNDALYALAGA